MFVITNIFKDLDRLDGRVKCSKQVRDFMLAVYEIICSSSILIGTESADRDYSH